MALISQVLETCLYVDNIARAEHFYCELFGLQTYSREENRHVFFKIGETMLLLFNPAETKNSEAIPGHGAVGEGHVAFTVSHEKLDFWRQRMKKLNIAIEQEYTWPTGGRSIYFRDPFDNSLELVTADTWP